jgi:2-aminoethylphosphonate-pyruvate transaminase
MTENDDREILLTPGPLSTAPATREAMLRDWGTRDAAFMAMTARIRARLAAIAGAGESHVCVPLQGSGTFAVEATIGTLVPPGGGKLLVLVNGAYGRRMARMCDYLGRACVTFETAEDTPPAPDEVAAVLGADPSITHVAAVHCETTAGILNPIGDIAAAVAAAGRRMIVDAMSSFGAVPLDVAGLPCDALIASANKCLEGVPGFGFAVIAKDALDAAEGNAASLSLDLFDQWRYMERTGQWRFTPPTQVIAALDAALDGFDSEGGVEGRGARYGANCRALCAGLREMGLQTFLPDALQAPVIVTIHMPADPGFDFQRFYDLLHARGVVIYPGSVTRAKTFRVGCIGHIGADDIRRALAAMEAALDEMGIEDRGPAAP